MSQPTIPSPDAKTFVIWDYKTCPIPRGYENVIAERITKSVRALDCHGPVSIKAYGSTELISDELKQALESQGIIVTLVPTGPAASNVMICDAYRWAMENPPPSNLMFITGNEDFADTVGHLKSKGHITLVVYPSD